jgi:hypothetical protein
VTPLLGILWLVAIATSGHALARAGGATARGADRLWHAGASVLLGLGTSSVGFAVVLLTRGPHPGALGVKDALLLGAAVILLRAVKVPGKSDAVSGGSRWWWLLAGVVCVSAVAWFAYFRAVPDGDWDAWMIWNMRARFFSRAPADVARAFAPSLEFSHPDYPLLVPGTVAAAWLPVGSDALWVSAIVSNVVGLACLGVVAGAVGRLRGGAAGALAGLVLFGAPFYVGQAAAQCADVPVSAFVALSASLLLWAGHETLRGREHWALATAGFAASLAAWTKNEGLLFCLGGGLAILLPDHHRSRLAVRAGRLAWFALGAFPVLLLLAWFKWSLPVQNDLLAASSAGSLLARATDISRYAQTARAIAAEPFVVGKWNALPLALAICAAWLRTSGLRTGARLPGVWLATVLAGFFAVYVLTPHDLGWHLATSLDRLNVQLWPLAVLAAFVAMGGKTDAADARAVTPRFSGAGSSQGPARSRGRP